jgi:two-component system sensor histidine kinase HydH
MQAIVDEIKTYVGFDERDAKNLRALADVIQAGLPSVVDRFYAEILRQPSARRVFSGPAQVDRLRVLLRDWLITLFSGEYGTDYVERRARIGHTHVRVGLPQHFMFAAMEVIWQELERIIREANPPQAQEKLGSLHKLLTIETGIMLESFRASYAERVRKAERDAVEERLSRAEQLAEIGQLAASLAHEIKNPLAGISGAIQVLRDELEPGDRRRVVLEAILGQVSRLDGTVKDLLAYARPKPPHFKSCSLHEVMERVATFVRPDGSSHGVRVAYADCSALAPIEGDEHQLEQLLLNLLLNSIHASRPGDAVHVHVIPGEHDVVLVIGDRGAGMDEATAQRAFDPFFTTKARGTGLGLPICRRIVRAHGGTLHLESEVGQGTVVEIRLPRTQAARDRGGVE